MKWRPPLRPLYLKVKGIQAMKNQPTYDREATPILTVEQIGAKRARTPEGFLLCQDVPIARVGMMIYGPGETPIEVNSEGFARVWRDADTLFSAATLASFNAKPVVNDHPEEDVSPENWRELTEGIVINPRRGEGATADCIVADLLITSPSAIADIEAGKREVSAGYTAGYEMIQKGEGRQRNIIGNHVALVEKGRCGPRCAIGDRDSFPQQETQQMGTQTVKKARATLDEQALAQVRTTMQKAGEEALAALVGEEDDGAGSGVHVHIHQGAGPAARTKDSDDDPPKSEVEERLAKVEETVDRVAKVIDSLPAMIKDAVGKTGDSGTPITEQPITTADAAADEIEAANRCKVGDSAALETSFRSFISDAEILVPGFRVPAFDAAAPRRKTIDSMCQLRRQVVGALAVTADGTELLKSVSGGTDFSDLSKFTCAQVATAFRSAAGARRAINNAKSTADANKLPVPEGAKPAGPKTPAELNKKLREFYSAAAASR